MVLIYDLVGLDPMMSRWMSADQIYDGVKSGMSIYGYCYNNPLIYHDPNGLLVKTKGSFTSITDKNDSFEEAFTSSGYIRFYA